MSIGYLANLCGHQSTYLPDLFPHLKDCLRDDGSSEVCHISVRLVCYVTSMRLRS